MRIVLTMAIVGSACSFEGASPVTEDREIDAAPADPDAAEVPIDAAIVPDAAPPQPVTVTFRDDGVYAGTVDTYIDAADGNRSFGTLSTIWWETEGGSDVRLGLLRFDEFIGASATQVPQNAEILSASLHGFVFDPGNPQNPGQIRRSLVGWDESTTAIDFAGPDGLIGTDEIDSTTFVAAPTAFGAFEVDVTEAVQGWVDDPTSHFGWVFFPTSTNALQARSSEAPTMAERPMLEVTYQP